RCPECVTDDAGSPRRGRKGHGQHPSAPPARPRPGTARAHAAAGIVPARAGRPGRPGGACMVLTFVNARIIDPEGYDGPGALRVRDGVIEEVARGNAPAPGEGEVIDCGGKALAPGLVDMRVFVGEPGARHRESFRSAGQAAAAGGVTTIVAQPDTNPPLDDPALVQFALKRARQVTSIRVHATAALT